LSDRLYELFLCYVRGPSGVLSWVRLLIKSTSRLNSRDYVRDRSTTGNPDNAYKTYNLSSLEPASDAYGTKSRQPTVTVTVHRSATSDFPQSKTEHDVSYIEPSPILSLLLKLQNRYATCIRSRLQTDSQFYTQGGFGSVARYCFSRHRTICRWKCRIKTSN
jgi:hypothetical protein